MFSANHRCENMMSASACAEASFSCADSADTAVILDAIILASIIFVLGVLAGLSLVLGVVVCLILAVLLVGSKRNMRKSRRTA